MQLQACCSFVAWSRTSYILWKLLFLLLVVDSVEGASSGHSKWRMAIRCSWCSEKLSWWKKSGFPGNWVIMSESFSSKKAQTCLHERFSSLRKDIVIVGFRFYALSVIFRLTINSQWEWLCSKRDAVYPSLNGPCLSGSASSPPTHSLLPPDVPA